VNNVSLVSLLGTGPCQEAGARPPPGPGGRARVPPRSPARAPAACTSAPFHVPHGPKLMFDKDKEDGTDRQPNETRIAYRSVRYSVDCSTGTSLIPGRFCRVFPFSWSRNKELYITRSRRLRSVRSAQAHPSRGRPRSAQPS